MSERLLQQSTEVVAAGGMPVHELGRVTILEALAQETSMIAPDALGRCTMQGNVDFDD